MSKRETSKIVEMSGRKWSIARFDALTGSYIAYQLMFQMLPALLTAFAGKLPEGESFVANLPKSGNIMDQKSFTELQLSCLGVCSEVVERGQGPAYLPVLMADNSFSSPDLRDDTMTVLGLTVHALIFNVSGFFAEGPLKDLMGAVPAASPDSMQ